MIVNPLYYWRRFIRIFQLTFFLGLFIGLIYYFGRVIAFLFELRLQVINLWNTSELESLILKQSNLEGLLLGNVLLLLFFGIYLTYNVVKAIVIQFDIHIRHSRKVAAPFPLRSSIFLGILLAVQWSLLLDLLSILDSYHISIMGYSFSVDQYYEQLRILLKPFNIAQIIIGNALTSIITITIIYRKSVLGQYIRERNMFKIDQKYITKDYFANIVQEEDPVLKNLRITQAYTDLSIGMSQLLGNENTNWATYASWASKTAGQSIRKEEVPALAKRLLINRLPLADFFDPDKADPEIDQLDDTEIMWNMYILGVIEDISISISKGNLKVFAELGPIFSSFIFFFRDHKEYDQKALDEFCSQFIPGPTEEGGQDKIKEAFSRYYRAIFVKGPKKKAEMMLLSNIQIGWHEQMRLQEAIETAVTAPLRHGYELVMADKLTSMTPVFKDKFKSAIENNLQTKQESYHIFVKSIVTSIMVLEIPGRKLILGENVPRYSFFQSFPKDLREIIDEKLQMVIEAFDPRVDSLKDSRAINWADLADRLGYIIDLFRTTQNTRKMFYPTFSEKQTVKIYEGLIPKGKL